MKLLQTMLNRRSVRKYTKEPISDEILDTILKAGLSAPTGHNAKPWEFVVVKDRSMLEKLSECRDGAAKMLAEAYCAVVVLADETKTNVWVEDASIAMTQMHLMADSLGVGSCWIQGRLRETADHRSTEAYVQELLQIPEHYRLEAILSLGMPDQHPAPHKEEELLLERIHREKF